MSDDNPAHVGAVITDTDYLSDREFVTSVISDMHRVLIQAALFDDSCLFNALICFRN